jgi:hypothetical protein
MRCGRCAQVVDRNKGIQKESFQKAYKLTLFDIHTEITTCLNRILVAFFISITCVKLFLADRKYGRENGSERAAVREQ